MEREAMRDVFKTAVGTFIGLMGFSACCACAFSFFTMMGAVLAGSLAPLPTLLATGDLTKRGSQSLGTPSPPKRLGSAVEVDGLSVALSGYEFSGSYKGTYPGSPFQEEGEQTEYVDSPLEGAQFLWLHLRIENSGQAPLYGPTPDEFFILRDGEQTDSDYYWLEHPDYGTIQEGLIFPGVKREGWFRFTVPLAYRPENIVVAYKPYALEGDEYFAWSLIE